MSASQINNELDKLDAESSKLNDKMIATGRGSEKPSEWWNKTDPLSSRMRAVEDRSHALRQEVASRYGSNIRRLPSGRGFGPRKSFSRPMSKLR